MIWIFDELFHKLSQLLFLSESQNQYFLFLIKLPRLVHILCGRCVRKEGEALIYITWFLYAISINLISSSLFFCLFKCFLFSRAVINSGFPYQLYFTLVAVCHSTEAVHEVGALPITAYTVRFRPSGIIKWQRSLCKGEEIHRLGI